MLIHENDIKVHGKTRKPTGSNYSFSSIYITIGNHIVGDANAESITDLLFSEVDSIKNNLENKKNEINGKACTNKNKIDAVSFFKCARHFLATGKKHSDISHINDFLLKTATNAFPQHNECFDGEEGVFACLDKDESILAWKDFETKKILSCIVDSSFYINQWNKLLEELKPNLS